MTENGNDDAYHSRLEARYRAEEAAEEFEMNTEYLADENWIDSSSLNKKEVYSPLDVPSVNGTNDNNNNNNNIVKRKKKRLVLEKSENETMKQSALINHTVMKNECIECSICYCMMDFASVYTNYHSTADIIRHDLLYENELNFSKKYLEFQSKCDLNTELFNFYRQYFLPTSMDKSDCEKDDDRQQTLLRKINKINFELNHLTKHFNDQLDSLLFSKSSQTFSSSSSQFSPGTTHSTYAPYVKRTINNNQIIHYQLPTFIREVRLDDILLQESLVKKKQKIEFDEKSSRTKCSLIPPSSTSLFIPSTSSQQMSTQNLPPLQTKCLQHNLQKTDGVSNGKKLDGILMNKDEMKKNINRKTLTGNERALLNQPNIFENESYIRSHLKSRRWYCQRRVNLFVNESCQHIMCRECLRIYLETAIDDWRVVPLPCPCCDDDLTNSFIYDYGLLTNDFIRRYEEYMIRKTLIITDNKNLRYCPQTDCNYFVLFNTNMNNNKDDVCRERIDCKKCSTVFCSNCRFVWNNSCKWKECKFESFEQSIRGPNKIPSKEPTTTITTTSTVPTKNNLRSIMNNLEPISTMKNKKKKKNKSKNVSLDLSHEPSTITETETSDSFSPSVVSLPLSLRKDDNKLRDMLEFTNENLSFKLKSLESFLKFRCSLLDCMKFAFQLPYHFGEIENTSENLTDFSGVNYLEESFAIIQVFATNFLLFNHLNKMEKLVFYRMKLMKTFIGWIHSTTVYSIVSGDRQYSTFQAYTTAFYKFFTGTITFSKLLGETDESFFEKLSAHLYVQYNSFMEKYVMPLDKTENIIQLRKLVIFKLTLILLRLYLIFAYPHDLRKKMKKKKKKSPEIIVQSPNDEEIQCKRLHSLFVNLPQFMFHGKNELDILLTFPSDFGLFLSNVIDKPMNMERSSDDEGTVSIISSIYSLFFVNKEYMNKHYRIHKMELNYENYLTIKNLNKNTFYKGIDDNENKNETDEESNLSNEKFLLSTEYQMKSNYSLSQFIVLLKYQWLMTGKNISPFHQFFKSNFPFKMEEQYDEMDVNGIDRILQDFLLRSFSYEKFIIKKNLNKRGTRVKSKRNGRTFKDRFINRFLSKKSSPSSESSMLETTIQAQLYSTNDINSKKRLTELLIDDEEERRTSKELLDDEIILICCPYHKLKAKDNLRERKFVGRWPKHDTINKKSFFHKHIVESLVNLSNEQESDLRKKLTSSKEVWERMASISLAKSSSQPSPHESSSSSSISSSSSSSLARSSVLMEEDTETLIGEEVISPFTLLQASKSSRSTNHQRETIKCCPRCQTCIVKPDDGTCNQMVCAACHCEFCWLCLNEISDLHYLSPSGCTFWGNRPWGRKKRILTQIGTMLGAPIFILLLSFAAIPSIIVALPILVGKKFHSYLLRKKVSNSNLRKSAALKKLNRHQRRSLVCISVIGATLVAPILAVLVIGFGVPTLLTYIYCVIPFSLMNARQMNRQLQKRNERRSNITKLNVFTNYLQLENDEEGSGGDGNKNVNQKKNETNKVKDNMPTIFSNGLSASIFKRLTQSSSDDESDNLNKLVLKESNYMSPFVIVASVPHGRRLPIVYIPIRMFADVDVISDDWSELQLGKPINMKKWSTMKDILLNYCHRVNGTKDSFNLLRDLRNTFIYDAQNDLNPMMDDDEIDIIDDDEDDHSETASAAIESHLAKTMRSSDFNHKFSIDIYQFIYFPSIHKFVLYLILPLTIAKEIFPHFLHPSPTIGRINNRKKTENNFLDNLTINFVQDPPPPPPPPPLTTTTPTSKLQKKRSKKLFKFTTNRNNLKNYNNHNVNDIDHHSSYDYGKNLIGLNCEQLVNDEELRINNDEIDPPNINSPTKLFNERKNRLNFSLLSCFNGNKIRNKKNSSIITPNNSQSNYIRLETTEKNNNIKISNSNTSFAQQFRNIIDKKPVVEYSQVFENKQLSNKNAFRISYNEEENRKRNFHTFSPLSNRENIHKNDMKISNSANSEYMLTEENGRTSKSRQEYDLTSLKSSSVSYGDYTLASVEPNTSLLMHSIPDDDALPSISLSTNSPIKRTGYINPHRNDV
ncbi:hypothetical protein SNEBB_007716 [Seison nebaliae]|nr:hypothetical protein SNEBB_007716 [Seison nebaliae]